MDLKKVDPDNAFGKACNSHDDYVWKIESSSGQIDGRRGKVGISTYFECDVAKENRADEIIAKVIAPVLNAHMGSGKLVSWGWSSHIIGGKFRRFSSMTAENIEQLLAVREMIFDKLYAPNGPKEAKEFDQICNPHQDYLWDVNIEKS